MCTLPLRTNITPGIFPLFRIPPISQRIIKSTNKTQGFGWEIIDGWGPGSTGWAYYLLSPNHRWNSFQEMIITETLVDSVSDHLIVPMLGPQNTLSATQHPCQPQNPGYINALSKGDSHGPLFHGTIGFPSTIRIVHPQQVGMILPSVQ